MRLLHGLAKTHASFDDPNLVSHAGLVPVMDLAERAGLGELVAEHIVRLDSAFYNAAVIGAIGGQGAVLRHRPGEQQHPRRDRRRARRRLDPDPFPPLAVPLLYQAPTPVLVPA